MFLTEDVGSETPVEEAYWVEAAERSDSLGVHVINTSLGYKTYQNPNYTHTDEDLNGSTTFITRGANIANEKGILVVTSAGNSGANGVGAPADATGVLSIAAVDLDGDYAGFSSQGSALQATQKPDVAARGVAAFVIDDDNNITNNNGTSFSSPIMAGGIASLWQALPNATNEEIKDYVRMSASQYTTPDFFVVVHCCYQLHCQDKLGTLSKFYKWIAKNLLDKSCWRVFQTDRRRFFSGGFPEYLR